MSRCLQQSYDWSRRLVLGSPPPHANRLGLRSTGTRHCARMGLYSYELAAKRPIQRLLTAFEDDIRATDSDLGSNEDIVPV